MNKAHLLIGGMVVSGLLWSPAPLHAQANLDPQHVAALEKRLLELERKLELLTTAQTNAASYEALEQKVLVLDRKRELDEESAKEKAKTAPVLTAGKEGFGLASADKAYALKLRGFVQADGRFYPGDELSPGVDTFLLRRARLTFDGTLGQYFDFRIAPDFGGGKAELQDGYLDIKPSPYANFRIGRTKAPFGIERLQSPTATFFIESGLPTSLTPNYDNGVHLYGSAGKGVLNYTLALVNGVPDGASSDSDIDDGIDFFGRVILTPFKNADLPWLSGLSFGLAGSVGDYKGSAAAAGLPSFKTSGQKTWFSYTAGAFADGQHTRLSPQLFYAVGSFGLLAEYVTSEQDVTGIAATTASLRNDAWGLTASYVLTGETPSLNGVKPFAPFNLGAGKWGAVELVARIGRLDVDGDAFTGGYADPKKSARTAKNTGVGLNWYLSQNVKLMADFEETKFDGGAVDGDRPTEKFVSTRAQLSF